MSEQTGIDYAKEVTDGKRCPYTLKTKNCQDCPVIGGKGWKCREKKRNKVVCLGQ